MTSNSIYHRKVDLGIVTRILYKIKNNTYSNPLEQDSELRAMYVLWNNLQNMAEKCPELLTTQDYLVLDGSASRNLAPFMQTLIERVIKDSVPIGVTIGSIGQPNENTGSFVANTMKIIRIPTAIRDMIQLLLFMHWSVGNFRRAIPDSITGRISHRIWGKLLNEQLLYAIKTLSVISIVSPELWEALKRIYLQTSTDPNTSWMYNNIYIQYIDKWDMYAHSANCIGVYINDDARTGVIDFPEMRASFSAIVEHTIGIQSVLGGKHLHVYLSELLNPKGVVTDMNSSLRALEQLLKRSVVVTDTGEILNVFISEDGTNISITQRDLRDTTAQFDDRPKVTSCKILVNGTEQEIIRLDERDITAIVDSMSRYIEDPEYLLDQEQIRRVTDPSPIQDLIANVQQQRANQMREVRQGLEMAREEFAAHMADVQEAAEHTQETILTDTGATQEGDHAVAPQPTPEFRIAADGSRQIRRVINGIELWVPEANIRIQEERRRVEQNVGNNGNNTNPGNQELRIHTVTIPPEPPTNANEIVQQALEEMGVHVDGIAMDDQGQAMEEMARHEIGDITHAAQTQLRNMTDLFEITPDGRRIFRGLNGGQNV